MVRLLTQGLAALAGIEVYVVKRLSTGDGGTNDRGQQQHDHIIRDVKYWKYYRKILQYCRCIVGFTCHD